MSGIISVRPFVLPAFFAAFWLDVGCILWRKHMRRCWEAIAPMFYESMLDGVVCSGGINVCCLIQNAMT